MDEAITLDWAAQAFASARPGIDAATVDSEQLTVTTYRYAPGSSWEEHAHPEDQVTIVVSGGAIRFDVGGTEILLRPGQLALIPGGVPHTAAVEEREVVTLNVWRRRAAMGT